MSNTKAKPDTDTDSGRYLAAAHRVQTAISFDPDRRDQEPKHLRVGIDTAKVEAGGLATLLIAKGVFTAEEYAAAMADAMEREADAREAELGDRFGIRIKTV